MSIENGGYKAGFMDSLKKRAKEVALAVGIVAGAHGAAEASEKPKHDVKKPAVVKTVDSEDKAAQQHTVDVAARRAKIERQLDKTVGEGLVGEDSLGDSVTPGQRIEGEKTYMDIPDQKPDPRDEIKKGLNNLSLDMSNIVNAGVSYDSFKAKLSKSKLSKDQKAKLLADLDHNIGVMREKNDAAGEDWVVNQALSDLDGLEKAHQAIATK